METNGKWVLLYGDDWEALYNPQGENVWEHHSLQKEEMLEIMGLEHMLESVDADAYLALHHSFPTHLSLYREPEPPNSYLAAWEQAVRP